MMQRSRKATPGGGGLSMDDGRRIMLVSPLILAQVVRKSRDLRALLAVVPLARRMVRVWYSLLERV